VPGTAPVDGAIGQPDGVLRAPCQTRSESPIASYGARTFTSLSKYT